VATELDLGLFHIDTGSAFEHLLCVNVLHMRCDRVAILSIPERQLGFLFV
jgi:hypothetical protein